MRNKPLYCPRCGGVIRAWACSNNADHGPDETEQEQLKQELTFVAECGLHGVRVILGPRLVAAVVIDADDELDKN